MKSGLKTKTFSLSPLSPLLPDRSLTTGALPLKVLGICSPVEVKPDMIILYSYKPLILFKVWCVQRYRILLTCN